MSSKKITEVTFYILIVYEKNIFRHILKIQFKEYTPITSKFMFLRNCFSVQLKQIYTCTNIDCTVMRPATCHMTR